MAPERLKDLVDDHGALIRAVNEERIIEIRLLSSRKGDVGSWLSATVRWADQSLDAALLEIADTRGCTAPIFADVGGIAPIQATAIGFPVSEHKSTYRETDQVAGLILPGAGWKGNGLVLDVTTSTFNPAVKDFSSPWHGISGAAMFVDHYLVAMILSDISPIARSNRRLEAMPVISILTAVDFEETALGLGVDLAEDKIAYVEGSTHVKIKKSIKEVRLRQIRLLLRSDLERLAGEDVEPFIARPVKWADVAAPRPGFIQRQDTEGLLAVVLQELLRHNDREERSVSLIAVLGSPGSGKTAIVRSICAQLARMEACILADLGLNQGPITSPLLKSILRDLRTVLDLVDGPVLLVMDDPFIEGSLFGRLFQALSAPEFSRIVAIAASPTLLYERNEWRIHFGTEVRTWTLGKPTRDERRQIATMHGRDPARFDHRADEFLVLTMEAASGRGVQEIVLRIWHALNGGIPIDPSVPPSELPWLVRSYLVVCAFFAYGQLCAEPILRAVLERSGDSAGIPSDLGYALDSLMTNEGWHIFSVSRRTGNPPRLAAAHGSIARMAMDLRPCKTFDPLMWTVDPQILLQQDVANDLSALLDARLRDPTARPLPVLSVLASNVQEMVEGGTVHGRFLADLLSNLDVRQYPDIAGSFAKSLREYCRRYSSDAWLAAFVLVHGCFGEDVEATEEDDDPARLLLDTVAVADLSLSPQHATMLIDKVGALPAMKPFLVRKAMDYLGDSQRRGPMAGFVARVLRAASLRDLTQNFDALMDHVYKYPFDNDVREAMLKAAPSAPYRRKAAVKRLMDEIEVWLTSQTSPASEWSFWFRCCLRVSDEGELIMIVRRLIRWLLIDVEDERRLLILAAVMQSGPRKVPPGAALELLEAACTFLRPRGQHLSQTRLVTAMTAIYRQLSTTTLFPRRSSVMSEAYDQIAMWYWEIHNSRGPDLLPPVHRAGRADHEDVQ